MFVPVNRFLDSALQTEHMKSFSCSTLLVPNCMPPEGSPRAGILPGRLSLGGGSREADAGFESPTFRSVNSHSTKEAPKKVGYWYFGGCASAMAAACTHPLDLIKVHLQTQQKKEVGMIGMGIRVFRRDGFFALYNGISASILRQLTYSMTRFGMYETYKQRKGSPMTFTESGVVACVSGFCGGIVGNPADMVNLLCEFATFIVVMVLCTVMCRFVVHILCNTISHWKVRGSNPTSASRLPLSRLGQPGSIPALVLLSGDMAARHRKGVTAERYFFQHGTWAKQCDHVELSFDIEGSSTSVPLWLPRKYYFVIGRNLHMHHRTRHSLLPAWHSKRPSHSSSNCVLSRRLPVTKNQSARSKHHPRTALQREINTESKTKREPPTSYCSMLNLPNRPLGEEELCPLEKGLNFAVSKTVRKQRVEEMIPGVESVFQKTSAIGGGEATGTARHSPQVRAARSSKYYISRVKSVKQPKQVDNMSITKTDKGWVTVVLNKSDYLQKQGDRFRYQYTGPPRLLYTKEWWEGKNNRIKCFFKVLISLSESSTQSKYTVSLIKRRLNKLSSALTPTLKPVTNRPEKPSSFKTRGCQKLFEEFQLRLKLEWHPKRKKNLRLVMEKRPLADWMRDQVSKIKCNG
ncbi:hypothetical protein CSKR_114464 [Clonorchis sinensis]|uniref:Uncharacterized protein n=1 Tax=Clonorchis sinensis TaxID=79923 RepID=A0A419PJQ9_CLOSI|nr:hypothetical protein CSKR_114464 [Clonorchis sinensis]